MITPRNALFHALKMTGLLFVQNGYSSPETSGWFHGDDRMIPHEFDVFQQVPDLEHLHRPCFVAHGFRENPNQILSGGVAQHVFHHPTNCSRCESPLRGLEGDRSERLPERLEDFFAQIKGGLGDHHLVGCHQGLSCEVIRKLLPDSYKHVIYIYICNM